MSSVIGGVAQPTFKLTRLIVIGLSPQFIQTTTTGPFDYVEVVIPVVVRCGLNPDRIEYNLPPNC